jgi:hypothetical protein
MEQIQEMHRVLRTKTALTREEFTNEKFWFEKEEIDQQTMYNRPNKLKNLLFGTNIKTLPEWIHFNILKFHETNNILLKIPLQSL